MGSSSNYTLLFGHLAFLILIWGSQSCNGFGTFGFDIHHRYSDQVKEILDLDGLPEMGSPQYYAAMAHHDRLIRGRRLANTVDSTHLTFKDGNETYLITSMGYLHYAQVSVGTPGLSFLVALDTGSDLFWLPCDCSSSCVHGLRTKAGKEIDFNIYSPNTSSTSMRVTCNSTLCDQQRKCNATSNTCGYRKEYMSYDTSTAGILVEDVLHLTTDDSQLKAVEQRVTFGCGMNQTGLLLDGVAPNGLFGLDMGNLSVPSILASEGLVANSFSMCFGPDGMGRISFGDKGSSDQGETPFNLGKYPIYNISMTQIIVGENATNLDFTAIFDTGTSVTSLNDPAYTEISESFNSQVQEKRRPSDSNIPYEYCYELSANQTIIEIPTLNLTMKGGSQFYVTEPIILVSLKSGFMYCLGILKSEDINIIGQNFMTGYRIVFDREKMVLGWKESDCYDSKNTTTPPIDPRNSTAVPPTATATATATAPAPAPTPGATAPASAPAPGGTAPAPSATAPAPSPGAIAPAPGATAPAPAPGATAPAPAPGATAPAPRATVEPEATPNPGNGSPNSSPYTRPPSSYAPYLNSFTSTLLMVTFSLFIHCFINLIS